MIVLSNAAESSDTTPEKERASFLEYLKNIRQTADVHGLHSEHFEESLESSSGEMWWETPINMAGQWSDGYIIHPAKELSLLKDQWAFLALDQSITLCWIDKDQGVWVYRNSGLNYVWMGGIEERDVKLLPLKENYLPIPDKSLFRDPALYTPRKN